MSIEIKTYTTPCKSRSGNYSEGTTVVQGSTTVVSGGGSSVDIVKELDTTTLTDANVLSSKRVIKEITDRGHTHSNKAVLDNLTQAVIDNSHIHANKELIDKIDQDLSKSSDVIHNSFKTKDFVAGMTGTGANVDNEGNTELESATIRRFLEVPELRYNRVDIKVGDKWRAAGGGVIKSVDTSSKVVTLKLEEGEIGAVEVGDICMGIFHSHNTTDNATSDSDDSKGNRTFAGFYTCYFHITEVLDSIHSQFRYSIRPVDADWKLSYEPSDFMNFVCYGNFTNTSRQTSVYETRTYTRMLRGQNTWEIADSNIAMQYGDLSNLSVFGLDMTGYSIYLSNIYMKGQIKQVKDNGSEIKQINFLSDYKAGDSVSYYDSVAYGGNTWLCINKDGTNTIPDKSDSSWMILSEKGQSVSVASVWQPNTTYLQGTIMPFNNILLCSNKDTSEPPLKILSDADGTYIADEGGNYLLYTENGSVVPSEDWTILIDMSTVADGADGTDGQSLEVRYSADKSSWHSVFQSSDVWMQQRVGDGLWSPSMRIVGESGADGKDGQYTSYEFSKNTSTDIAPTDGWQDAPPSVGDGEYLWMRSGVVIPPSTVPSSWATVRIKGDKGDRGIQGIQGCVIRDGEWKEGVEYLNQSNLTTGGIRYIDVALVEDSNAATGWAAYECIQSHTSAAENKPDSAGGSSYWAQFSANVTAIFTSLVIAKNAKIKFLQGNQLLLMDSGNNIVGGLSGFSTDSNDIRLWIGGSDPSTAPYRVLEDGSVYATKMHISGDSEFDGIIKLSSSFSGSYTGANIYYLPSLTADSVFSLPAGKEHIGKVCRLFNSSPKNSSYVYKINMCDFMVYSDGSSVAMSSYYAILRAQETIELTCLKKSESSSGIGAEWQITSRFSQTDFVNFSDTYRDRTIGRFPLVLGIGKLTGTSTGASISGTWWNGKSITSVFQSVTRTSEGNYLISTGAYSSNLLSNDYVVMATGLGTSPNSTAPIKATIKDKGAESFRILLSDDDTVNDGSCEFVIFGGNWNYNLT